MDFVAISKIKIINWDTIQDYPGYTNAMCLQQHNTKTCLWLEGKVTVTEWPERKTIGIYIRRWSEVGPKTRNAISFLKRWKHTR